MNQKKTSRISPSAEAPAQPRPLMRTAGSGIGLVLVTLLATFVYLALFQVPAANEARIKDYAQQQAALLAGNVAVRVRHVQARMRHYVQQPEVRRVLAPDEAGQDAWQVNPSIAFPEAVTARLVALGPLGIARLSIAQVGALNNLEKDLLVRISRAQPQPPDGYQSGQQALVSLAEPVAEEGASHSEGALLVTLPADYFARNLLGDDDGQVQLLQRLERRNQEFLSSGTRGVRGTVEVAVPGTQWLLVYTPSASRLASLSADVGILWVLFGLCAVVALISILLTGRQLMAAVAHDLALLRGRDGEAFVLPGFAEFHAHLKASQVAPGARGAAKPAVAEPSPAAPTVEVREEAEAPIDLPTTIFRAYDIRGLADQQLSDAVVMRIGMAIGSEALERGQQRVLVAMDGRLSSPRIKEALVRGLRSSGRDVVDIGEVATPLLYFATHRMDTQSGVMVTGSHNPAEYNGLKIVLAGRTLSGPDILALKTRIEQRNLSSGKGSYREADIRRDYLDYILNDVAIAQPLKVVVDAGNGITGALAPQLFQELGCEVVSLHCEVDGNFPNHHPDPTVADNLRDLIKAVKAEGADLGVAFDGDGDRVGVVSASGQIIPADRLLMLLAQDVVARNPGADVLFDVKSTRHLNAVISNYGGRPIMWKSGHSFMKDKMAETGALVGGEFSGHIFFNERWFGFDDGMYAAARLIEILSTSEPDLDAQLAAFPSSVSTPELKVAASEEAKFAIVDRLIADHPFQDGKVTTLDGLRADYSDGWGLVRASNTTPALVLRFEADTEEALARIQSQFKAALSAVDPALEFGF
ncbi:MAG TPA: phosphomannomutase/phosphoglucomutase [Spongiibacteraceae bacterium]|nr:phosphomannomutase/phosphoglucomutase [Spongiibacteraceae bacterium]